MLLPLSLCFAFCDRMISAWDTFFEVDDYYTYKKPVGHGAYGVVISALDTRDNSKVRPLRKKTHDKHVFERLGRCQLVGK